MHAKDQQDSGTPENAWDPNLATHAGPYRPRLKNPSAIPVCISSITKCEDIKQITQYKPNLHLEVHNSVSLLNYVTNNIEIKQHESIYYLTFY